MSGNERSHLVEHQLPTVSQIFGNWVSFRWRCSRGRRCEHVRSPPVARRVSQVSERAITDRLAWAQHARVRHQPQQPKLAKHSNQSLVFASGHRQETSMTKRNEHERIVRCPIDWTAGDHVGRPHESIGGVTSASSETAVVTPSPSVGATARCVARSLRASFEACAARVLLAECAAADKALDLSQLRTENAAAVRARAHSPRRSGSPRCR